MSQCEEGIVKNRKKKRGLKMYLLKIADISKHHYNFFTLI